MNHRTPPEIKHSEVPQDYKLLAAYFDWWAESLDMVMPGHLWQRLKDAKAEAIERDDRRKSSIEFMFGGEAFQLLPTGAAGGKEFVLIGPDLRFEFGSPKRSFAVNWRATAAGLWEYGLEALHKRVFDILEREQFTINSNHWRKLSRVDFAFDIEAPSFTGEMIPEIARQVICPKESKTRGDFVARNCRLETLTIGSKKACQVQVYDKGLEITELSGKTWMIDIWMENGYAPEIPEDGEIKHRDVWRLEARMAGDWLKSRTGKDPEEFLDNMWSLIAEALYNRRITLPTNDSNRYRWPLHPLYSLAVEYCGNPGRFMPTGRRTTEKADVLQDMLLSNIAGTLRSLVVLRLRGALDEEKTFSTDEADKAIEEAMQRLLWDREHKTKIARALDRYAFVDEAI
ncbi:hypothetical protein [Emcibacter nanhaiensis]|uniref:Replication initiation factor domain-containing protein n=1 Tax=Emcibacter nanhaiensis TaxID=1505037 RepID=A0A501PRC3_9PROT|nr:hypothetical protein [Emcibacter nanhaiensis]TPD63003.1 hypothetical protein FIV46_02685 [Emcibacter nanhaiensis]